MKKRVCNVISALMIAALVFTSGGFAFAADSDEPSLKGSATEQKQAASQSKGTDLLKRGAPAKGMEPMAATGSLIVRNFVTGLEKMPACAISYKNTDVVVAGKAGFRQAVYLKKGTALLQIQAINATSQYVNFGVYTDANLSNLVSNRYGSTSVYAGSANKEGGAVFEVPATGTYYIAIYTSVSSATFTQNLYAWCGNISDADRTLSRNKWAAVGGMKAKTNYFKFKAAYTGYIKAYTANTSSNVALCNSSKKALSTSSYVYSSYPNVVYGVQKGKTYYLRVNSPYSNYDGVYMVKYANGKITEKSGSKKSKAVTIKKKKTKKGSIIAGSSKVDWYKFKLTSKKKLTMVMKGASNKQIKINVYYKGKKINSGYDYISDRTVQITLKSYSKLPKGTYYVKVYRGDKYSSGWYSLYWK